MSYDIRIVKKRTGETVNFRYKHAISGGTYALGGTPEAWLNVTYNYSDTFERMFGEQGVRSLYGKPLSVAVEMLQKAIDSIGDAEPSDDYWDATDGNAKQALKDLLMLAELALIENEGEDMSLEGD